MRALINAYLHYGKEEVPVGIASVATRKEITLKTLHERCGKPISLKKWCASCEEDVGSTVRGWEQIPGSFVHLTEDDLALIKSPEGDKTIVLSSFTPIKTEIPVVDKSYWLVPSLIDGTYWALHAALKAEKAIGVGRSVLWGKESPCAVTAAKEGLYLSLLFYDAEIASCDLTPPRVDAGAVGVARKEIAARTTMVVDPKIFSAPTKVAELLAAKMAASDPLLNGLKKSLKTVKPKVKS